MQKRTEDDITTKAPFAVSLGSQEYKISPLTILPAREWRQRLVDSFKDIIDGFSQSQDPEALVKLGLTGALMQAPERMVDLVFAYSPALAESKDKIMAEATEEQFAVAFGAVMGVAFPFLAQLSMVRQVLLATSRQ